MIAYFAILFTKILGALYSIPFYAIVGEEGGVLYSYSYTIYNLFLSISTAGIPVAMSIVISEYNALKYYRSKQRAYKTGLGMISIISAVAFLGLFIFAEQIAAFYVKDIVGGPSVADIALNIRSISLCLVVIPFLSVTRGYFQGHEYLSVSSYSQIIEQIMRIFVVLAGSFIAMRIFNASATIGVAIALSGAFIGGIIAFLYLISKYKKNNRQFNPIDYIPTNEDDVPIRAIIKRILYFSIPLVLVSVSTNLYTITDMKLVLHGLTKLNYSGEDSQLIASIITTWSPKICMIITSLATGLSASIVPHITKEHTQGNQEGVVEKFNSAAGTVVVFTIPLAAAIMLLGPQVYRLFYGESLFGGLIMRISPASSVLGSVILVMNMALQSLSKSKLVYLNTFIGLGINAALDLPLIYMCNSIGLPPYYGAVMATFIGYVISLAIIMIYTKRKMGFEYKSFFNITLRSLWPTAIMCAIIIGLSFILPSQGISYAVLVLELICYALVAGGAYLFITYKNRAIQDALGDEFVDKILYKLRLKKR